MESLKNLEREYKDSFSDRRLDRKGLSKGWQPVMDQNAFY